MQPVNWNNPEVKEFYCSGTADLVAALDNAAVADLGKTVVAGKQLVSIPATAHGFLVNSTVVIIGTADYDGMYEILNLPDVDHFAIEHVFDSAENVNGHNAYCAITEGRPFRIKDFSLHMNGASGTAENLTLTIDAIKGAAYDSVLFSEDTNGLADMPYVSNGDGVPLKAHDVAIWAHTNTDANAWSITAHYEVAGR